MCAIFGIGFLNNYSVNNASTIRRVLDELFDQAEICGRDASGIALVTNKEINVIKNNVTGRKFVTENNYIEAVTNYLKTGHNNAHKMSILGHCRAQTKGTSEDRSNNHPIVTGKTVGIHNGIITNDEELWDILKATKKPAERCGRVDSEIIFKLIDNEFNSNRDTTMSRAIQLAVNALSGSFACAAVNSKVPWMLYLFRKELPIDIVHYNQAGLLMFATRSSFIQNAVSKAGGLGKSSHIVLNSNSGICINLLNNKLHTFSINNCLQLQPPKISMGVTQ